MYLTKINKKTGLVELGGVHDGVLAFPTFKKLIDNPKFGIEAFTCVALTVDHMTPIRNYAFKERHKRAMRDVMGKTDAFPWGNDLIQNALILYADLQYDDDLAEISLLQKMRKDKFAQARDETDEIKKYQLLNELTKIKKQLKEFESGVDQAALLDKAPSKGDYDLKRLEQKLINKKSFYHDKARKIARPSKEIEHSDPEQGKKRQNNKNAGKGNQESGSEPSKKRGRPFGSKNKRQRPKPVRN